MANPHTSDPQDPRLRGPLNPVPPLGMGDPTIDNPTAAPVRSAGSGWLIAMVIIVLVVVAYFVFGRSGGEAPPPAEAPAATAPAPATPAPATPAPATAPDNSAAKPAEPAPAPATPPADNAMKPAAPAPAPAQ